MADGLPPFFKTTSVTPRACLELARQKFPNYIIEAIASQGGCSYTLIAKLKLKNGAKSIIVQFRLIRHAISWTLANDAMRIYGDLVPKAVFCEDVVLGEEGESVQVFGMSAIQGVGVDACLERLGGQDLRRLLAGLAHFLALGWKAGSRKACTGRIGSSILDRLTWLERDLPSPWLRERAHRVKVAVRAGELDLLPVVLSHGDLLPSNILVDRRTYTLVGLVDWAEAEYLPFGVSLYGVEHLLGSMTKGDTSQFEYREDAVSLRQYFRDRLQAEIYELKERRIWRAMLLAREVGIFLWHGIAWDNGKLDRVVNSVDDDEELAYLEGFLTAKTGTEKSML